MKRLVFMAWVFYAGQSWTAWAVEEDFTHSVSPADFTAAGLGNLTPEQLTRLNALAEAYKSGALAAARRAADAAQAAQRAAEIQAAQAEAKAAAAKIEAAQSEERAAMAKFEAVQSEAKAAAAKAEVVKSKKEAQGLLARAKAALTPAKPVPVALVETTIPGKFHGWSPRQVFVLANGQTCQVANQDSYYAPVVENPRVQLVPAAFAGYWLRFPDLDTQVRVNLVGEN